MKGFTILVVDDNKQVREILEDQLSEIGARTLCFDSGKKALDHLQTVSAEDLPQLIISDLIMSNSHGADFFSSVKTSPQWKNITFWFISGADPLTASANASGLKPDGFIAKPWNFKELEKKIKPLIKSHESSKSA